ncbi:hypothetical protein Sme01_50410 [Sphaerisporangium melleum]|uniref:Secreted protein n=1 Tax=Sphaerisporangium melleum TaxID=321316 RepID=A0A917VJB5_9ACTN|nr:hypothetical protein [Sphaerisporangium melleum]GGK89976.1 hypothetical protein GCM10007964_35820 [Sphaerisporangium melleum]GII72565.1 hypothetical protein Sme01_50410 [Sphaerisporangium melleum]
MNKDEAKERREVDLDRLDRLRGAVPPRPHDARAIAALAANPGCARRSVLDAAGIDKDATATHLGFPAPFGRSPFAITRGNAFEALVKESGCAELLRLLRELLGLPVAEAAYTDLGDIGGDPSAHLRHAHTRTLLDRAARDGAGAGTLYDHPLLRLEIAGQSAYLEPDVVAFLHGGRFHIVEIKSFAVIDGQAEPDKAAAAARQAAVYVLALKTMLEELGHDPGRVAHDVVLVCPENFANRPAAALVDVRRQLAVLRRQLARMTRVGTLVDALPPGLTFDLAPGDDGVPGRPAAELREAVRAVEARYAPDCLSTCDLCFFCRDEAAGQESTDLLGRQVRDALGGVATVGEALGLADGSREPGEGQEEIARLLRLADRMYAELS